MTLAKPVVEEKYEFDEFYDEEEVRRVNSVIHQSNRTRVKTKKH